MTTVIRRTDVMCAGTTSGTDVHVTTISATSLSCTNITATALSCTNITATAVSGTNLCGTTLSGTNVYGAVTAIPGHTRYTFDTGPLTASTCTSGAHSLGAIPTYCQVSLVCMTATNLYAANDEVYASPNYYDGTNNRNFTVYADATNVGVVIDGSALAVHNKGSAGVLSAITLNKWQIRVRLGV